MIITTLYIILCSISVTFSGRILAIFPSPSYSHQLVSRALILELHSRGHEIAIMTTDPLRKQELVNYKEIDLSFLYKYIIRKDWSTAVNKYRLTTLYGFYTAWDQIAEEIYALDEVKDLIKNEHFDLVILEWSTHASFTAFSEHFNCPLIGLRSLGLRVEAYDVLANPVTPSYLPVAFMEHRENFIGRVINTMMVLVIRLMCRFITLPNAERIANIHFPNHKIDVEMLEKNVSIIFTYTNPVIMGVRPLVPSVVEIGGLHLERREKTLTKDMQEYLDNSKQGVIFFSLGSSVSSEEISQDKLKILAETFSELPYNVLVKLENNPFNKTIKNVRCFKWLSQESILGHPNVLLFISHGGLQSLWESVSNRVPLIGMPFHTDQFYNVHRIVELGIGIHLDFENLTKSNLLNAIHEIFLNPSYKQRIVKIAKLLKDQPISPMEKAVWWTEYVLRHKGAPHFRSKAVGMPWYIYYSLDVICLIIFILMIISYIIYRMLKCIHSIICLDNRKIKTQ